MDIPTINVPFTGKLYEGQPVKEPIQYFRELLDDDILANLVTETNRYALQSDISKPLDISVNELEQFFGIVLLMSIVKMSCSRMYWDKEMRYDKVADVMSRRRFETIKKNLHCVNNEARPENCTDKLFKVRPFVDSLNANFMKTVPAEHLSCDEQIVPFKGKSGLKQYNQKKPKKWGYKFFVLCGVDGLIHNFEIYDGAIQTCPGQPDIKASGNIVLRLLQNIPRNVGHKIYCDNWFTGMSLVTILANEGIHYVGTARLNRLPGCKVPNDKELKKKGRGAAVIETTLSNNVEVRAIKWFDNRGVMLVSTYAGIEPLGQISRYDRVAKRKIDIACPDVIKIYNKSMGGVDLLDMLIALYRNPIRSKKWYHRIVFHLLDTVVVQAWNLYRRDAKLSGITDKNKITKLQSFRYQIACCLCKENKVSTKRGRPSIDVDELQKQKIRKGGGGAATTIPPKAIRNDQFGHWPIVTSRARCKFPSCKAVPVIKCVKCDAHLCLNSTSNCFMKFHGV